MLKHELVCFDCFVIDRVTDYLVREVNCKLRDFDVINVRWRG